ncbi:MAG: capsule biosynthesis protein [Oceanospirillaceae bacterium]|nr:capsule biosynthesis protein [Oceanospirillaceae bacterium]
MTRGEISKNAAALLWAAWRRRYLIAIPMLLMPLISLSVSFLSTKQYESSTTLLFQEASQHNPFLEDLSIAINLKSRMNSLNALLHSRHILASVAWKMKMFKTNSTKETKSKVIQELSKALSVELVGDNIIKIRYKTAHKKDIIETLNTVSLSFIERVLAPQRSAIIQSENFLALELKKRRDDLNSADQNLAQYKNRFASELPELHAGNVNRLNELQLSLTEKKVSLQGAIAAKKSMASRLAQTNPVVGKIEESIIILRTDLTLLRSRYTDQHSQVQNLLASLQALQVERNRLLHNRRVPLEGDLNTEQLDRLWAIATTTSTDADLKQQPLLIVQLERLQHSADQVQRLSIEVSSLEVAITKLKLKVDGFGVHEQRLNELKREIQVRQNIYQDLSERYELARVTGSLGKAEENDRVKLIDAPFEPLGPSNLPLSLFLLAGIVCGIGLGTGLALTAELLDTSIRRKSVVRELLGIGVISRIPPQPEGQ